MTNILPILCLGENVKLILYRYLKTMEIFTIKKTLFVGVPANVVFEALTNSSKIVQYYPLQEVISDWQVGSEIICKGINDGKDFIDYGTIDILIPNQKFQYTYWSDNHGTQKTPDNHLIFHDGCVPLCPRGGGSAQGL